MSIESFIIDGARSPIGTKNGQMVGVRSDDLAAQVIQGLMQRNANIPVETVEDVVVGCAFPEGPQGMLMARSISVLADLPIESGAKVVNRFCGSSMDSVHQLSQAILAGDIDAGIAAGVEDMFSVPMGGFNPSFHPDLYEKEFYIGMGDTAEILAKDLDINFLGEIPIFTSLREASDFGRPGSLQENSVIENIFRDISKLLVEELIKRNNELPPTKIVKITNLVGCSAVKKKS